MSTLTSAPTVGAPGAVPVAVLDDADAPPALVSSATPWLKTSATPRLSKHIPLPGRAERKWPWMLAAMGAGAAVALSSRLNGTLAGNLGNPILGAAFNFGNGLMVLCLLALIFPQSRAGIRAIFDAVRGRVSSADVRPLRWYELCGGIGGSVMVVAQGTAVPVLGLGVFMVALVCGQMIGSLLIDRAGLGPAGKIPVTPVRLIGPALAIMGVMLSVSAVFTLPGVFWLIVLPIIGGITVSWQHAVNGRTKAAAATSGGGQLFYTMASATVSFLFGFIFLVLVNATIALFNGGLNANFGATRVWMYLGPLLGIIYVGTSAFCVGKLGVLQMVLLIVSGNMIGALVFDTLLGNPPLATTIAGAALTVVAASVPVIATTLKARRNTAS